MYKTFVQFKMCKYLNSVHDVTQIEYNSMNTRILQCVSLDVLYHVSDQRLLGLCGGQWGIWYVIKISNVQKSVLVGIVWREHVVVSQLCLLDDCVLFAAVSVRRRSDRVDTSPAPDGWSGSSESACARSCTILRCVVSHRLSISFTTSMLCCKIVSPAWYANFRHGGNRKARSRAALALSSDCWVLVCVWVWIWIWIWI